MQAVRYARAASIDDTVRLLEQSGPGTRLLAGGTDVIVQARERRRDVDLFVDVKHVPEMMALAYDDARGLSVGAAVPLYRIYGDDAVRAHYPALVEATSVIGGVAVQGRASLGGNLCNASPAADSIPAMIALEATVLIAGPGGRREMPVEQFCTAPGQTALGAAEFVVALRFPPPQPGSGAAWQRFTPRNEMDIAVVNAAVQLRFAGERVRWARVAIGAVAPTPLLVAGAASALTGRALDEQSIAAAAEAARSAAQPIDDMRGSARQRRHLVGVLVERTLREASLRARGGEQSGETR